MDKCTFGNSKAAINLVATLEQEDFKRYSRLTNRLLSKQIAALKGVNCIPDKITREAALLIWDKNFTTRVKSSVLPEVIQTHILCVATAYFRRYLAESRYGSVD